MTHSKSQHTILVVDDEPVQRRILEAAISKMGHKVVTADSGEKAVSILTSKEYEISALILDLIMPGMDGIAVLKWLQSAGVNPPVIVQTATGGIETVVNAMQNGAFDFVVKPISPDRLATALEKALKFEQIIKAPANTRRQSHSKFSFKDIVTANPVMERVLQIGLKAAASQIPVLIEGESGVGKELIARAIQGSSARASKAFVTVNCGALPENLVESILFGHEKGAFTGASEKHIGKFEEANGGTLFLDEIGELPLDLQVKLLRAIQEGEIDPIGARKPVKVDIRVISATNRDLMEEVKKGNFREDLYYRLNVLPMTIPPLRKRPEDIPALTYHFVKRFAHSENKPKISAVEQSLMKTLQAYQWPGNIRELENAIFRAIVLCDGDDLTLDEFPQIATQVPDFNLPGDTLGPAPTDTVSQMIDTETTMTTPFPDEARELKKFDISNQAHEITDFNAKNNMAMPATGMYGLVKLTDDEGHICKMETLEAEAIRFALEIYNGRISEVARRLGMGRSTLYRKLRDYGIVEFAEQSED